jgi:hypothetical protein
MERTAFADGTMVTVDWSTGTTVIKPICWDRLSNNATG